MTTQRAPRRNRKHPGVRIFVRANGAVIARWNDPLSGALTQQSLDRLGLSNQTQRVEWAVAKSAELANVRRAMSLGQVANQRQTIRAAIADYLATIAKRSTRIIKQSPLEALAVWCDENGLRDVQALAGPKLMRWRDHVLRPDSGRQPSTNNRWLITCGVFLRWCHDRGMAPLLASDTIRRACGRAPEPHKAIEILRPPQVRKALEVALAMDAANPDQVQPSAPWLLALLATGCRWAELAGLRWDEVDLEAAEVRLPAARTKTNRARVITMRESASLRSLLEALHEQRGDRELVFRWRTHGEWHARAKELGEAAGCDVNAHVWRRTAGSVLTCAAGIFGAASVFLSSKRLGHGVALAEQRYLGVLRDLPADAKTIEAAVGVEDVAERIVKAVKGTKR